MLKSRRLFTHIKQVCLCLESNFNLASIYYNLLQVYELSLEDEIRKCETSDGFREFMSLILKHSRDDTGDVDVKKAEEHARLMHSSGDGKLDSDSPLLEIMAFDNLGQLSFFFDEYKKLSHQTVHMAIRRSMSGDLSRALLTIGTK